MRPKALVIVQCNTIAAADASGICGAGEPSSCRRPRSPDGAKRHPGEAEPRRLPAFRFAQWERQGPDREHRGAAAQLLISRSSTSNTMAPTVEVTIALTTQGPPIGGR